MHVRYVDVGTEDSPEPVYSLSLVMSVLYMYSKVGD